MFPLARHSHQNSRDLSKLRGPSPEVGFVPIFDGKSIDDEQVYTGQIHEERGFLALRGQSNYIGTGQKPGVVASSNVLMQYINGRLMSALIDDDETSRKMDGLIGIQVHKGPAMKMEARNLRLRLIA